MPPPTPITSRSSYSPHTLHYHAPRSPLPKHPSTSRPPPELLSPLATTLALRAYLSTFLLTLNWDPRSTPAAQFINQHAWLLADELRLPEATARSLFIEIFDATTPTIFDSATAILGVREVLGCDETVVKALERLWTRNQGITPRTAVEDWSGGAEEGRRKIETGVFRRRVSGVGWMAVLRVAVKKVFGGGGKEADDEGSEMAREEVKWKEKHPKPVYERGVEVMRD